MIKIKEIINRIWKDIREFYPAAIIFVVYYFIVHLRYDAFCPLLITTGIPCAGCGLTRAGLFLLQGQPARAAYINPAIFPIVLFLFYCGYFRYIRGMKIRGMSLLLGLLIACMLILYVVRMYLYFPDRVPCVYHGRNVLSELVPGYRDWIFKVIAFMRQLRAAG